MPTLSAAAQALAFVGALGLVLCGLGAALLFTLIGRRVPAQRSLAVALLVSVSYTLLLFAVGAASKPRLIAHGDVKPFCEIDCHVVYGITSAYDSANNVVLTVREQFDGASVSRSRGDAPMHPGTRRFALVDTSGRAWRPTRVHMLDSAPLFASMRPGESRRARLSFSVPPDAAIAGLLVEDDNPISPLLIGHERSPLHRKTLLVLPRGATRVRAARAPSAPEHRG